MIPSHPQQHRYCCGDVSKKNSCPPWLALLLVVEELVQVVILSIPSCQVCWEQEELLVEEDEDEKADHWVLVRRYHNRCNRHCCDPLVVLVSLALPMKGSF